MNLNWKKIELILLVVVLSLATLLFISRISSYPLEKNQIAYYHNDKILSMYVPTGTTTQVYTFRAQNFTFSVPQGWSEIATTTMGFGHDGVANPTKIQFAFQKNNTDCIWFYSSSLFPAKFVHLYTQTSFANDSGSSWYVKKTELPDSFQFQWEGKQSFPNEIRMSSLDSGMFVLYDKGARVVGKNCDAGFSTIFSSIHPQYEKVSLSRQSKSLIYAGGLNYNLFSPSIEDITRTMAFFAVSSEDGISQEITPIDVSGFLPLSVYQNKIYFPNKEGLQALDLFSNTIKSVPGITYESGEIINDFYFYKNKIFYFVAPEGCSYGKSPCTEAKLFEYDLSRGVTKFLARDSLGYILGFDSHTNSLILAWRGLEEGCSGYVVQNYNFSNNTLEKSEDLRWCEGDTGVSEKQSKVAHLSNEISTQFSTSNSILVDEGQLKYSKERIRPFNNFTLEVRFFYP